MLLRLHHRAPARDEARNLKTHGKTWFNSGELETMLRGIFDQCDFLLDKDDNGNVKADEDEIDELWAYTLAHWSFEDHMLLVKLLIEIGCSNPTLLVADACVTDITGIEGDPRRWAAACCAGYLPAMR